MLTYSDREKSTIIREYLGPAGKDETPRCPRCGEVLQFRSEYRNGVAVPGIEVHCSECQRRFTWEPSQPAQPWKLLHLEYFVERYKLGGVIRCPADDCYVTYTEFSDDVIEFRCPYCNRRGRAKRPRPTVSPCLPRAGPGQG